MKAFVGYGRGALRAMTLIELLIVLAVLGLLVAMAAPSLSMARSTARQMDCASNLRQLGTGCLNYADAHKGYLLESYVSNDSGGYLTWEMSVFPYVSSEGKWSTVYPDDDTTLDRPRAPMACGVSTDASTAMQMSDYAYNDSMSRPSVSGDSNLGFAISNKMRSVGKSRDLPSSDLAQWGQNKVRLWQIQVPSMTHVLADSQDRDLNLYDPTTAIGRHSGKQAQDADGDLNVIYYDGHASLVHKQDMRWQREAAPPWLPYTGYPK